MEKILKNFYDFIWQQYAHVFSPFPVNPAPLAPAALKTLVSILIITVSTVGFTQETKEDWPEGSAVRTLMDSSEELERLDTEINNQNKALIELIERKRINPDLRLPRALSDQSNLWRKFRSADCYLASAIDGGGGSWPEANAVNCEVAQARRRIQLIGAVVRCIAAGGDTQLSEGAECLRALQVNINNR